MILLWATQLVVFDLGGVTGHPDHDQATRAALAAATVRVDRARQWEAIAAHASQSADNPVLRRRLELLDDRESLRALR